MPSRDTRDKKQILNFVGDLSNEDANILIEFACGNKILEFGSGGSTQLFAHWDPINDRFPF